MKRPKRKGRMELGNGILPLLVVVGGLDMFTIITTTDITTTIIDTSQRMMLSV